MRLIGGLLTALLALGAAALTMPGLFRINQMFPIVQAVSFRTVLVGGFGVLLLFFLLVALIRPLRVVALAMAAVCLVSAVANAVIVLDRGTGTDQLPSPTDTSVRVMTWNTAGSDATSPEQIAQTAVAMGADIVSLPETTIGTGEDVAIAMRELGQPMWAHHVEFGVDSWDARSTTILISPELGDYSVIESSADGSSNTGTLPSAVAMPVSGEGPIVVAVHAVAPRPGYMSAWRDDLRWLADQCVDEDVIMAGDFNATIDHMHGLGVGDAVLGHCNDAARDSGNGAVGTWPTRLPALLGAPIDHVMYSDHWRVTGSIVLRSLDRSGSDHRPLVVQLEPVD